MGSRSWGGPSALFGYKAPGAAEAQAAINPEILVVAMIESTEGLANAAGIAAVEGIDGLLIGTSDLTAEMGISGQILHPRVEDAYRSVGAACRKAGKFLGMGGVYELDAMKRYVDLGARFILTGSDHGYILAGATLQSASVRKLEANWASQPRKPRLHRVAGAVEFAQDKSGRTRSAGGYPSHRLPSAW